VVFDPFNEAIVLQRCEYELDVPLAALGGCVEGRHIADLYRLWINAPFVQSERFGCHFAFKLCRAA